MSGKRLTLRCPDCEAELVIDIATGAVLSHRKQKAPLAGGKTFEGLFSEMEQGKHRAEKLFEQEKAALADRDRLLEERFEEAMKRAEESGDEPPPRRPFDLD
jgi:hypothetical protein